MVLAKKLELRSDKRREELAVRGEVKESSKLVENNEGVMVVDEGEGKMEEDNERDGEPVDMEPMSEDDDDNAVEFDSKGVGRLRGLVVERDEEDKEGVEEDKFRVEVEVNGEAE
jgi:hypothetical protein